jgi:nucleotide-binding universal stress UspA family protein
MAYTPAFRSIIVPVDGSKLAEGAIAYALALAERVRSKVRFVLVYPEQYPPLLIEPANVYLKELTQQYRERLGDSLSSIILNGPVAPSLVKHVREIGADLVVMTTHGRGGLRRAWLGSVTDELIRTIEIPLMVVRPQENEVLHPFHVRQILVPLDGSLLAEVAVEPALAVAKLWNAEISLLQVVHPAVVPTDVALPQAGGYDDELTANRRDSAQEYLQHVISCVRTPGARVSGTAVVGIPAVARTVLDLAKPEHIDLIAMATHGRGGLGRLVLGSTTDKVVRAAEVPVLVVPHTGAARLVAKVQREMTKKLKLREEVSYA